MTLPDELLRQVGNNPFRAAIGCGGTRSNSGVICAILMLLSPYSTCRASHNSASARRSRRLPRSRFLLSDVRGGRPDGCRQRAGSVRALADVKKIGSGGALRKSGNDWRHTCPAVHMAAGEIWLDPSLYAPRLRLFAHRKSRWRAEVESGQI